MAFPFFSRKRRSPIPFLAKDTTPLLRFGSKDVWTIEDAFEATMITGAPGSGKTSSSGRALATAFLRSGFGGLVLCAKVEEIDIWRKLAAETGRSNSLIVMDETAQCRFNFMDYAQAVLARRGFDQNLISLFEHITEATAAQTSGGGGENPFFREAAMELLSHTLPVLHAAYGTIRLAEVMRFIDSAPQSRNDLTNAEWRRSSFCAQTLFRATKNVMPGTQLAQDMEQHGLYWSERYPSFGDKTRSSIVATLTASMSPFLVGKLNELFCTDTNILPELTHEGAIIVLDLPAVQFKKMGIVAQQIFKYLWQLSMQRRSAIRDTTRPVFLWADEAQLFLSPSDAEFLSVSRSSRACTVYLTQDIPNLEAMMPGSSPEASAKALLAKFGTRIFHANTDKPTCEYASSIIGKVKKYNANRSHTRGGGINTGGSQGEDGAGSFGGGYNSSTGTQTGYSEYLDYEVPPEYFGNHLRTGGRENRLKADAILIRNGKLFRHGGRNRLKVEFTQK